MHKKHKYLPITFVGLVISLFCSFQVDAFTTAPGYVCNINYSPQSLGVPQKADFGDNSIYGIMATMMDEWDDNDSITPGLRIRNEVIGTGSPGQLYVGIAATTADCTNNNYNITSGYFYTWNKNVAHSAPYSETALMNLWTNLRSHQSSGRKVVLKGVGSSVPLADAEFTSCDFRY